MPMHIWIDYESIAFLLKVQKYILALNCAICYEEVKVYIKIANSCVSPHTRDFLCELYQWPGFI